MLYVCYPLALAAALLLVPVLSLFSLSPHGGNRRPHTATPGDRVARVGGARRAVAAGATLLAPAARCAALAATLWLPLWLGSVDSEQPLHGGSLEQLHGAAHRWLRDAAALLPLGGVQLPWLLLVAAPPVLLLGCSEVVAVMAAGAASEWQ